MTKTETTETTALRSEPTFVLATRIEQLQAALTSIGKRARKLGVTPPTLELTGNTEVREKESPRSPGGKVKLQYVEVVVAGQTPKFPGWNMVAVVSHEDGVVDVVPGETCPPDQRDRGTVCDHCQKNITTRKKTMVLRKDETNEIVQVGTTCIGDFLGALKFDPQAALRYVTALLTTIDSLGGEDGEFYGGAREAMVEDLETILVWTAGWLVNNPWISGGKAFETRSTATKSHVIELFWPPRFTGHYAAEQRAEYERTRNQARDAITDEHRVEVKAALSWVQESSAADESNDYLAACATLAENGWAAAKRFGYACSILTSYRRHVEREEERRDRTPRVQEHVGKEKDRLTLDVRLAANVRVIDGDFGTSYLHTFIDAGGRLFKWFGARPIGENRGQVFVIKGTVKGHGEFRGNKETSLSRVTVIVEGEGAPMEAARELLAAENGLLVRPDDDPAMLALEGVQYMKRAKAWRFKK